MICGQLLSDGYTFKIKSLVGGQISIDPSGNDLGSGCLQLNASIIGETTKSNLNSDLLVFGDIYTSREKLG